MILSFGTYAGNGTANTSITGIGFQPDMVIVKGNINSEALWTTAAVPAGSSVFFEQALAPIASGITALEANGFQIGTSLRVNASGTAYRYLAFKDNGNGDFKVGTYVGNGTAATNIAGVGFQPEMVIVKSGTNDTARWKAASMGNTSAKRFTPDADGTGIISALQADGFQVGADVASNANGITYYYAAFKNVSGFATSGVWTGNGTDNTNIAGVGFQPDYLWVKAATGVRAGHKSASNTGEPTMRFNATVDDATDVVQAFQADGFQVGLNAMVNSAGVTYHYMAWKAGTTPSSVYRGSWRMMSNMGR